MNALHRNECSENGAPTLDADEQIISAFESINMYTNTYDPNDEPKYEEKGVGILYVTTKRIVWIHNLNDSGIVGFAWDMTYLSLHATSRDLSSFPRPCLYCQLDVENEVNEIRFVPNEPDKYLQKIFDAFSASAALNPDEEDEFDGPVGGDWIYNEDEVVAGAREAQLAAHFDSILQVAPSMQVGGNIAGQFDDADDDKDDELI